MLDVIELIIGLLIGVAALSALARKMLVPPAIVLVVGGALFGLIPGLPPVHLDPDMVFLFLLPPLLYPAALFTSWRDFQANLRTISLLAVGLVLFTTAAIAWLAYSMMGMPLAAGFVLGAIISPPDAVAATAITQRLRVPRRIITILEGESLVNDATALVAYRFAVTAVVTGTFSWTEAGWRFPAVAAGGIAIGLVIGHVVARIQQRLDDPPIQATISLLTPYAAFVSADHLGVSGVLAVVTAGVYLGWRSPEITTARMRLVVRPVWETIGFVLNGFVFILIGLQLPDVLHAVSDYSVLQLTTYALLISLAVIVIRLLWVYPAAYVPRWLVPALRKRDPYPAWQHVMIVAWTGMRGVVSLAAALAIPFTLADGSPFPGRSLILFLTCTVIVATLVVQGLSLPVLIRWLDVTDDGAEDGEEREARLKANQAALARLNELAQSSSINADVIQRMRVEYEDRIRQLKLTGSVDGDAPRPLFAPDYETLSHTLLRTERDVILHLRNEHVINDEVLRRVQRDIDLAEARLHRRPARAPA
ncbi:MAG: Na+/H+ antiporter [Nitrospirota bacterium]